MVHEAIADGLVRREEVFITSKLFPQSYPYEQAVKDIDATLERLGLDYLDLLLLHQPYGEYVSAWKAIEEAVQAGKLRSIGLSNFSASKTREILDVATIPPAVNQVEINPRWNQHALKKELADTGILYEGWYPLGHGDPSLLAEPAIVAAAARTGATQAQVVLAWHLAEGNVIFPKTLNPAHMADNLAAASIELSHDEVDAINAIPQQAYYTVPDQAPEWVWGPNDYSQQV